MMAAPLQPLEFETLCRGGGVVGPRLAVAVSGGPDSMALVWGAKAAGFEVVALIVEHGLRAESADEARLVQTRLAAMGIPADILPWQHGAVTSRVHVRAREARYALLIEACKARGLDTLLLAHHRDDQAETVLMRLAKGSGLAGLSGMAAISEMAGVRLVRPLLGVPKARLVATCEEQGIAFVTDPSNMSDHYARGRLRRVGDLLAQEGFAPERLVDLAARAGEAAQAIEHYAKAFLREKAQMTTGGAVRLDTDGLMDVPRAVALQGLALCLMTLRRGAYPPERAGLLIALDAVLGARAASAHSFYGCLIQKGEKHVMILREPAAVCDVQKMGGQACLWDSRWQVSGADAGEIRALGVQPHDVLDALAPHLRAKVPQGRVRAALPALWKEGQLVAIPYIFADKKESFQASFLPPLWL